MADRDRVNPGTAWPGTPQPGTSRPGTTLFLNGSSSAGKTTLARELQTRLDEPYLHIALDQFRDGLPDRYRGLNAPPDTTGARGLNVIPVADVETPHTRIVFGDVGRTMLQGMRRAMAAMVQQGNNIIIDDIILEPEFLSDYLAVFRDLTLYFVGVRCPINIVNEREAARPGRFPGTAVGHIDVCHAHNIYDVEVDTSGSTPEACASSVVSRMRAPPVAFERLRRR